MDAVKPLDYAPRLPATRRVWRLAYRIAVAAAVIVAWIVWGPAFWRRVELAYWERRCLEFSVPANHPVMETQWFNVARIGVFSPQWQFDSAKESAPSKPRFASLFLHEMRRPDGTQCLVEV